MKRINSSQRSRAHTVWMPRIERIFAQGVTDEEAEAAARHLRLIHAIPEAQLDLELTPSPMCNSTREAGFGSSPSLALEGNSDPVKCVDSGAGAY